MDHCSRLGAQGGPYFAHSFPHACPSFLLSLCHHSVHPSFPTSPGLPRMVFSLVAATWVQGLPSPLIHPALSPTVSEAHRWAGQPLTAPLPRVEGRHPAGQTDPKATLDLGPSPSSHKPTNTCTATQPSLQRPHLAAGSASFLVLSL